MRNRNWKCVEISVCGRTEWRRNFCTVLSDIPDCNGASGTDNGISSRKSQQKSAVLGYKALEKPNSKWHIHGWVAIFGCYMLMMYYTTVSGWMVTYFYKFVKGEFTPRMDAEQTGAVFSNLLADPKQMAFWMILTVVVGFFVCSRGLQNGLEKSVKL